MKLRKELPLITIVLIPFIYLAYIWKTLPKKVPMHWNINGEIDRFGTKFELILIPVLLPLLVYILFLLIPKIDPKNKLKNMGNKYDSFKLILTIFMSVLALMILYFAKNKSFTNPNYIILLIGFLYIIVGNFSKTIRPNYFIGFKTPWTLENEIVWKDTHLLVGKLWFIGGLLIIVFSLILDKKINTYTFIIITSVITIIPVIYSYLRFKTLTK